MHLRKSDVIATATEILDNYGIADLTMRRLARELDVTPGALYWHFANKQQLLGAVADTVLRPACAPVTADAWQARIQHICAGLRDALLSHTDGAELVSASFAASQSGAVTEILDQLAAAARDAGVARPHADLAARTVLYYVLGFTVDEQSRMQWDAAGTLNARLDVTSDATARFEFGLTLLVDGIAVSAGLPSQHDLPASTYSAF
ncbi:MAG: TetR/AcrR family transcriptional regulator C-terminal domain-containing protein [Mycobacterium sp.]